MINFIGIQVVQRSGFASSFKPVQQQGLPGTETQNLLAQFCSLLKNID